MPRIVPSNGDIAATAPYPNLEGIIAQLQDLRQRSHRGPLWRRTAAAFAFPDTLIQSDSHIDMPRSDLAWCALTA